MGFESPIFAYFRVFRPYFRVNSVGKSYWNAIINYLHENNANYKKIFDIRRSSGTSGLKVNKGRIKMSGLLSSSRETGSFSHLFDNLGV